MLLGTKAVSELTVSRDTLSDRAADRIRDLILVEDLKPHEVLAERELAEKLGISRTPLREALRVLAAEGLVEMEANKRPRVCDPSLEQLLDLVDVLAVLERLAGETAALRITEEELARIEELVIRLETFPDDGDALEYFRTDMRLHSTIVEASGNQPLLRTHDQYNAALFRARFMSSRWASRRPLMNVQHRSFLVSLRARDGKAAGAAMFDHLMQLKANLQALFREREAREGKSR
jgi:DNA-binding GntR family transcriptional regulator